jgi:uncharacterized protein YjbI with pentapeptide repeats
LRLIAWIGLAIAPVALLVFFELQFLPYHDEWISWSQRLAVVIDLLLLWVLWPAIANGQAIKLAWQSIRTSTVLIMACVSLASALVIFAVATFPGEWLARQVPSALQGRWPVTADADQKAKSPWSNRLVLPASFDVVDHKKFVSDAEIAASPDTVSLRLRSLDYAVLRDTGLQRVDFTQGSLRNANLDGVHLEGALLNAAHLEGATLNRAHLEGAAFDGAYLAGASLWGAHLEGASLWGAHLQGASFALVRQFRIGDRQLTVLAKHADLWGALLVGADLRGAWLYGADLRGAWLYGANLQGAVLDHAHLEGAWLEGTHLEGASLKAAYLEGASLDDAFIWRTDIDTKATRILIEKTHPTRLSSSVIGQLRRQVERAIPEGDFRDSALGRIDARLGEKFPENEKQIEQRWAELQHSSMTPEDYYTELVGQWRQIACGSGSPYVIGGLSRVMLHDVNAPPEPYSRQLSRLVDGFMRADCADPHWLPDPLRVGIPREAVQAF